jgi:hypothetical protein
MRPVLFSIDPLKADYSERERTVARNQNRLAVLRNGPAIFLPAFIVLLTYGTSTAQNVQIYLSQKIDGFGASLLEAGLIEWPVCTKTI